jgi:hypothetical protein
LVRGVRICAALRSGLPLTELRPLAALHLVRAYAVALVDLLAAHDIARWHRAIERITPLIVEVAHEAIPSRSRPRIAHRLGASGG